MPEKGRTPQYPSNDHTEDICNGTEIGFDPMQTDLPKSKDLLCGIWCFHPSRLQSFAKIKWFIPVVSLSIMTSFAHGLYAGSQVTSLEKQFGINSTESGLLLAANDIGFLLTVLLWSHFGRNSHKPRLLSIASIMFAIIGLAAVIPHLLMLTEAEDLYDTTDGGVHSNFNLQRVCLASNSTTGSASPQMSLGIERIRQIAFIILFITFVLQGVAKAPRTPTLQTYIDENVPRSQTGIYIGVTGAMGLAGIPIGIIIGGVFSQIYVTLQETNLTPRDPRWIGAWWVGFVLFSLIAFVSAIPLALFPRRMPNAPIKESQKQPSIFQERLSKNEDTKVKRVLKDFLSSFLRILKNPLYMLLVVCDGIIFVTVSGRNIFYPKYLEQHFRVPMGRSNFLFGMSNMIPLVVSVFLGGVMINRFRLTIRGSMVFRWLNEIVIGVTVFLALVVTCQQPIIYGLSNPPEELKFMTNTESNLTCDTQCMCLKQDFMPSCGADGLTYFSPCHAGCMAVLPGNNFGHCDCVPESPMFNQTVRPGYCDGECESLTYYLVLSAITVFLAGLDAMPSTMIKLRSVEERDRDLAIGFSQFLISSLGFFLGPIIFGRIVDSSCILWSMSGFCSLYDTDDLRLKMHIFMGGVLASFVILNGVAVLFTFKMDRYCEIVESQRKDFAEQRTAGGAKQQLSGCDNKAGDDELENK